MSAGPLVMYAEGAVELLNTYAYPSTTQSGMPQFTSPDELDAYPLAAGGVETSIAVAAVELSVTGEYLYHGLGYSDEQADLAFAAAGAGSAGDGSLATPPLLRRHYALATFHADIAGYAGADLATFVNLDDLSGALQGRATLLLLQGIDLWLGGSWFFGEQDTEFGRYPPDNALPGRLQIRLGATAHF